MKRVAVMVLLLGWVSGDTWACGTWFPNAYLVSGNRDVYHMPETCFSVECQSLLWGEISPFWESQDLQSETEFCNHMIEVDLAEFAKAVGSTPDAVALIGEYTTLRQALSKYALNWIDKLETARNPYSEEKPERPIPFDLAPYESTMAKLPLEFAHYIRGAVAYRNEDYVSAMAHFSAVLDLPEEARKYRSVWAAFMLGKAWLQRTPTQAAPFFVQTRALTAEGYRDGLGLAADSLGWQARAEYKGKAFLDSIQHYIEYGKEPKNRPMVVLSLDRACSAALSADPVDAALAADPLVRQVLTAWAISHPASSGAAKHWLDALEKAELTGNVPGAERLAWLAYERGEIELAQRWLELCDANAPYAQWVRAKLLLREGKFEEGAVLLDQAKEQCAEGPAWVVMPTFRDYSNEVFGLDSSRSMIAQDLGFVLLKNGDYASSLRAFLDGGDWEDAACLADRILTVEELERVVAEVSNEARYNQPRPSMEYGMFNAASSLRYVLARRLARAGAWDRAVAYYPATLEGVPRYNAEESVSSLAEQARTIAAHLTAGQDGAQPPRTRAGHFFEAAKILREWGLELTGTEEEPDWGLWSAQFFAGSFGNMVNKEDKEFLSEDFRRRFQASAPVPDKRFHYRYRAAEWMEHCAALLPDNDVLAAQALYLGGKWLGARDPAYADKFYKALVRRNPNLLIARQADQLRWFPEEFTDTILYRPLSKPPWYGTKRRAAVVLLTAMIILMVLGGLGWLRLRRGNPEKHPA